jgi:outer membrane protein OmpA-like peptidoglycan-associated protein
MSIRIHETSPFRLSALLLLTLALSLTACAPTATTNPALDEARAAFQAAQANPTVVRSAPLELKQAEMQLTKADELFQQKEDLAVVEHHAYLSKQYSAIAQEIGNQKIAEAAIAQASEERNRVLLEARTAEATMARQQAEAEKAAAMKAMEELEAQRQAALLAGQDAEAQRLAAEQAMLEARTAQEKAEQLARELADLQAVKAERGMVVTLGAVVFDFDKAALKPAGLVAVDKLAAFMNKYPERRVMVEGFTDSVGSEQYNLRLSERRANAVREALVARGIEANRIETRGYGKAFPVATNATAAGRQLNRRVEIIISDETGKIPPRTR